MATRRERLRAELIRDIKATALAHLRERGADGLSLRAVARDLGVSAPGLYRYYSGRDDLLTALIADCYHDLADHMLVAIGADPSQLSGIDRQPPQPPLQVDDRADPGDQMIGIAHAYRAWGLAHPHEFGLIYGDPIPGYAAPEGGVTVEATLRVGTTLLGPIVAGWQAGAVRIPPTFDADLGAGAVQLRDQIGEATGGDIPVALAALVLSLWSWLHGIVSLEVFGHFHWIYPDGAEPLFDAALRAQLAAVGLEPGRSGGAVADVVDQPRQRDRT
jgi:AcrR family transcriptional regulator